MKRNIIKDKSFKFAVRIIRLYQYLRRDKREYILSKQVVRSGTSVGAMIRESEHAETRKDFLHKIAVAQKEINETIYWLDLLKETDYLTEKYYNSIHSDAVEIIKIITSILISTKKNNVKTNRNNGKGSL